MLPARTPDLAPEARAREQICHRRGRAPFSVIEELASPVAANLQRAATLPQSILDRAYRGEVVKDSAPVEAPAATMG
jgi:hypothetical protein